jgi:phosphate transport system substrate-binding protein
MKNVVLIALVVGVLAALGGSCSGKKEAPKSITLSGAWAIYPTAVAWAEAFMKLNPGVKVDVSAGGAGKGAADAIAGLVDIGMVSREPDPAELAKGVMAVYMLHDAVFPVISDKNPVLDDLLKKGIAPETWQGLYIAGTVTTWGAAVNTRADQPVHVYTRSDACGAASAWAAFMGKKQENLKGIGVYGDPGLLEAALKDPVGIGYSSFSYVFTREGALVPGIRLVPIDSNGNGIADSDEVYTDRAGAIAAIRAGRYPATRKNYFFVKGKPQGTVQAFIEFALSEAGTKIVDETGTSLALAEEERGRVLRGIQ